MKVKEHSKTPKSASTKLVQKKLWNFNYSVKTLENSKLIVDGGKSIKVVESMMNTSKTPAFWDFHVDSLSEKDPDIYAFAFIYPDSSVKVRYAIKEDVKKNLKKNTLSFHTSQDSILEESPCVVLGASAYSKKYDKQV